MYKCIVYTLVLAMLLNANLHAQDVEFSQFYVAPLYLNPALAGIAYGPRLNLNYRNQWPSLQKGYVSYAASYDMHIDKINSGIGIQFLGDRVANGIMNTYVVNLLYSYQIKLSRKFGVKIGVEGGIRYKQIDKAQLTFSDMIDNVYGFVDEFDNPNISMEAFGDIGNVVMPDFGVGFLFFSPKVYGGLAVKHITQPKSSFLGDSNETLPIRLTMHAGGDIDLTPKNRKKDIVLSPNILFTSQSNFSQLNIGSYVHVSMINVGVWYRYAFGNSDAVIGVVGVETDYLRIAYSYDFTVSSLGGNSGGAHEVSFAFNLKGKDNSLNPKKNKGRLECPKALSF